MIQGLSSVGSTVSTTSANGLSSLGQSTTSTTQVMESGPSFASVLSSALGNSFATMKQAEQLSIDAIQGKADMRKVVDTVMSAEQSLQAAVAIRDKIVSAYLEVSRMAI